MQGDFVAQVVVKATLVLAAAWILTVIMRRSSAAARHLIWSCALFAIVTLPAVVWYAPEWSLPVLPVEPSTQVAAGTAVTAGADVDVRTRVPRVGTAPVGLPRISIAQQTVQRTWISALAILWLGVAIIGLAKLGIALVDATRMARRAQSAVDSRWCQAVEETAARLQLRTKIFVRTSRETAVPVIIGMWHSVLLLPTNADEWPTERRRAVLLHELAHVKRHDCLLRFYAQAAAAVYWFHPLVHIAVRRLRTEQEHACDDVALSAGLPASDYARHLFHIAQGSVSTTPQAATVAMARLSHLEERMLSILDPTRGRSALTPNGRVTAILIFAAAVLLIGTLRLSARQDLNGSASVIRTELLDSSVQIRDFSVPREWSRYVEQETRERVREALLVGQNDQDDQVRDETMSALEILESRPDGRLWVAGSCRANCVANDEPLGEQLRLLIPEMQMFLSSADFHNPDVEIRRRAVMESLPMRSPSAIANWMDALRDPDHIVRMWAAIKLDSIRSVEAAPAWIWLLGDADSSLRERAAISLGAIGDPQAVDALTSTLLNDAEPNVRRQAARSLGYIASGENN